MNMQLISITTAPEEVQRQHPTHHCFQEHRLQLRSQHLPKDVLNSTAGEHVLVCRRSTITTLTIGGENNVTELLITVIASHFIVGHTGLYDPPKPTPRIT